MSTSTNTFDRTGPHNDDSTIAQQSKANGEGDLMDVDDSRVSTGTSSGGSANPNQATRDQGSDQVEVNSDECEVRNSADLSLDAEDSNASVDSDEAQSSGKGDESKEVPPPCTTFYCFPKLPAELRRAIWRFAAGPTDPYTRVSLFGTSGESRSDTRLMPLDLLVATPKEYEHLTSFLESEGFAAWLEHSQKSLPLRLTLDNGLQGNVEPLEKLAKLLVSMKSNDRINDISLTIYPSLYPHPEYLYTFLPRSCVFHNRAKTAIDSILRIDKEWLVGDSMHRTLLDVSSLWEMSRQRSRRQGKPVADVFEECIKLARTPGVSTRREGNLLIVTTSDPGINWRVHCA